MLVKNLKFIAQDLMDFTPVTVRMLENNLDDNLGNRKVRRLGFDELIGNHCSGVA
jgi:hypothetical protein